MEHSNISMILSSAILIAAYGLIIWDKLDRAVVAISGAALMILLKLISQENAFGEIDFNTLGLLIGMMVIVMTTKRSGVFEYLAIKTVKLAKGEPVRIIVLLSLITGVLSGMLDNVTTILLILPVTLSVAKDLRLNPVPFILAEVFASNVGGTATLIGDPPNIMIGSSAGLSFMAFIRNIGVFILPLLFLTTYIFVLIYRKKLVAPVEARRKIMGMDEKSCIRDRVLLRKSLLVLGFTIIGFILHGTFHYESATIAMAGAAALLMISGVRPEKVLMEVEWKTIFFFIGLFIMVGGVKEAGVLKIIAQGILDLTHGNLLLTTMAILWVSAIVSAFLDNIPFVATMMPLIKDMGALSGMNLTPIWWALSLGACLGGNGTIIGASANVIAVGMAEEHGHKITFVSYLKVAFPVMLLTIILSSFYLYFFCIH